MRVRTTRAALWYAALAALLLAGCSGAPSPEPREPVGEAGELRRTTDLLAWEPVPGPVEDQVVVSGRWSLRVPNGGAEARLDGPRPLTVRAPERFRVVEAFLDQRRAVVVAQDRLEERPSIATAVDLRTATRVTVDGRAELPTTTGGSWGYRDGVLAYATVGPDRAYCLATVTLPGLRSELAWCAPARHGFSNVRLAAGGGTLMSFDDGRPQCRTLLALAATSQPLTGPEECTGWEAVRLEDGLVWGVVENPNRIEQLSVRALLGDRTVDLGPADSGSLVACGDAAYFTAPSGGGEPARMLRWRGDGTLAVVYRAPGRPGFLTAPRCGGATLTVTAYSEGGDEQVAAPLRLPSPG